MTRNELSIYFPDTYHFFYACPDVHPFWQAVAEVDSTEARRGQTVLSQMELVFSNLHKLDGHYQIEHVLFAAKTLPQLMHEFSKLYVAWVYRDHAVRLAAATDLHDIELTIDGQHIGLTMLGLHDTAGLNAPWHAAVEATDPGADVVSVLARAQAAAEQAQLHRTAAHVVVAAITPYAQLPHVLALRQLLQGLKRQNETLGHVSAIVLVSPAGTAQVIPVHQDNHELEYLLEV